MTALMQPESFAIEIPVKETFGGLLRFFRERAGRSRNSLCIEVGCSPSYGTRLESGEREPPRIVFIEGFARVLRLSIGERNRLLVAAGYAPLSVSQLGSWSESLQAVTDVLTDHRLSPEDRDEFERTVIAIAHRWRPS